MPKVFLGVGHGGKDPGAVGAILEKTANLEMALACRDYLIEYGVDVKLSREFDTDDSLTSRIRKCNDYNPDLAIDIHNNAGGGDGFEVYYHAGGGTSLRLAQNIERAVMELGQNSRGCKVKLNEHGQDYFGFIRETKTPAIIAEGVFVDNQTDVKIADTIDKQRAFGRAYGRGILKTLGIDTQRVENNTPTTQNVYRVQVGAFSDKANALKLQKQLIDIGFTDTFIV